MNNRLSENLLLTLALVLIGQFCYAQDSTNLNPEIITVSLLDRVFPFSYGSDYPIEHFSSKKDIKFCKKHRKLITAEPTQQNSSKYFSLACSLWQLSRLEDAEKMFLIIMDSKNPFYTENYYNSSDIPNDTTQNTYGYGSYTFNYKNAACRYLTKIYIEEKKFDKALKYLEFADKKYHVVQNCGTGYREYRNEIDGLYGMCYEGTGKSDSIINLFLPNCFEGGNERLIRALKKVYSQTEIKEYLKIAENSMIFVADSLQSSSYITYNYGKKDENITEIKYTSGTAILTLFGRQIIFPQPELENGQVATKELYITNFRKSGFCTDLIATE